MNQDLLKHSAAGAAAGLAGTAVLQALALPAEKYLPQFHPPQTEDPASFMLWQAEKRLSRKTWLNIPPASETAAAFALSFGYGATFGALYGALGRDESNLLIDGAALGLICWAAGYLGWLPAAKLTPPPWRQTPAQLAGPIIEHLLYGVATVAACKLIGRKW